MGKHTDSIKINLLDLHLVTRRSYIPITGFGNNYVKPTLAEVLKVKLLTEGTLFSRKPVRQAWY